MPNRHFTARLDAEALAYLAQLGERTERSLGWMVNKALRDWVAQHREGRPDPLPPPLDLARDGAGKGGGHTPSAE